MKLYRIKRNDGLFWTNKRAVVPFFSEQGDFFTEDELSALIKSFKYQRKLWPADVEVVMYEITSEGESNIAKHIFEELDKEITYESLKG